MVYEPVRGTTFWTIPHHETDAVVARNVLVIQISHDYHLQKIAVEFKEKQPNVKILRFSNYTSISERQPKISYILGSNRTTRLFC